MVSIDLHRKRYGFDTASVEREFGIPDEAEVVALLAMGRAREPDKPYLKPRTKEES
jgi:nitroreductase